jgi:hypothetical protein
MSGAETNARNNEEIIKKIDLLIDQNREMAERYEQLLRRYEQLAERSENLRGGLIQNLREFYAILLETLSAAIGSRIENIYERIAGNDDYQRNDRSLTLIQFCVITVKVTS